MVNSLAAMSTEKPNPRNVDDVTDPIEAVRIPFTFVRSPRVPSSSTKFLTVDELVNVTICGRRLGFFRAACKRVREASGTKSGSFQEEEGRGG